jgi:deazaflavin-dependent oxidoreductase (nitroreductase family)
MSVIGPFYQVAPSPASAEHAETGGRPSFDHVRWNPLISCGTFGQVSLGVEPDFSWSHSCNTAVMGIDLGTWNFKEKPTGLWRRVLRIPVYLFRWRLGFIFGDRFVLVDHVGRSSGKTYETVVEVVDHDEATDEYVVCSGTGPGADWYRNLVAAPAPAVQVGRVRWAPTQRLLDDSEAAERFAYYEQAHAKAAARLLSSMGNTYDGSDDDRVRMMAGMPMVAFGPAVT